MDKIPVIQTIVAILWPSFIGAGIATIVFFTIFDPAILFVEYDISIIGAYSIGFFTFWLFGSLNCMATCCFLKPCKVPEKNGSAAPAQHDS